MRALGRRYGSDSVLTGVKITGVNSVSQETMLPHARNGFTSGEGVCPRSDDVANWIQAGYSDTAVLRAWRTIARTFALSFPEKQIAVMLVPRGFPSIRGSGEGLAGQRNGSGMARDIIADGIQSWGRQFVVQNNGLSAFWSWREAEEASRQTATGYQMLWSATGDRQCRMNHGASPCDPRSVIEQAISRGIGSGASFLEIYIPDILNPDLEEVIAHAHTRVEREPQ